jgi:hypothetical protein
MSRFRAEHESRWDILNPLSWKAALGGGGRTGREQTCSCGQELPVMERYVFTYGTGAQAIYLLGQCRRCHKIFWEDA